MGKDFYILANINIMKYLLAAKLGVQTNTIDQLKSTLHWVPLGSSASISDELPASSYLGSSDPMKY